MLGLTTLLYTIPSLAMFSLLLPLFGLSASLVVTGLVLYSLTILVRNVLAGLEAVPEDVREAARGMGYGPRRLLWQVEMPLALPSVLAGIRIATVSTIALTTIGSIVGKGGLGNLIAPRREQFLQGPGAHRLGAVRAARAGRGPAAARRGAAAHPVGAGDARAAARGPGCGPGCGQGCGPGAGRGVGRIRRVRRVRQGGLRAWTY
ncbi:hypothetical protein GCM10020254_39740 [Streptomyces goshikiensis]